MTTAVKSMKFAWTAFVIPFVFVFGPGLLMVGDIDTILLTIAMAAIGPYLIFVAFLGCFSRPLNFVNRLLCRPDAGWRDAHRINHLYGRCRARRTRPRPGIFRRKAAGRQRDGVVSSFVPTFRLKLI